MVGILRQRMTGSASNTPTETFRCSGIPAPEAAARAQRWVTDALPREEKVPETMLRTLIGARAEFGTQPRHEEKSVEWGGTLSDGGSIKLVYFKRTPLSDGERRDAVETLSQWAS